MWKMAVNLPLCFLVLCFIKSLTATSSGLTASEKDFVDIYNAESGYGKPKLVMDEAWLTINNSETFELQIYAHNHQCWKCNMVYIETIDGITVKTLVVNSTFGTDIELRLSTGNEETMICRFDVKFREKGDYWLFYNNSTGSCIPKISNDPMAAEMPILYTAAGVVALCIIVKLSFYIYRKVRLDSSVNSAGTMELKTDGNHDQLDSPITTHNKRARLKSLDTLRGLSLVIMIFVNYGGGGYWFFGHLPWNGLTVADLVFPWFVFMMGASMNYSFKSMFKRKKSRLWILAKVLKRSFLLFGFGIILNTNWGPVKLTNLRIPGVLQRLSLSYLVVALTETAFTRKSWENLSQNKLVLWTRDVIYCFPQWIVSFVILGVYLGLMFGLPVPDCPTGYIGPGGLHDGGRYANCTGGAAGYIDRLVLGDNHIYSKPTPKTIYQTTLSFDPEGILGTLTSIFQCFLGLQAGRIFVVYTSHKDRIGRLLVWSVMTGAIGAGLCNFSMNDGIIPINKNLWSVSYVMVTGCFAYFLLCLLYVIVDIFRAWDGDPFIFTGMNPLVIFLCHDIFYRFFPVNFVVDPVHWQLLLKAVWDVIIWVTLGYVLYVKKIFIAL